MTNKLTKNDSMRNEAQDFKTIVAAFEAILSRNNVHLDYFANWSKAKELNYGDSMYAQWLNWICYTISLKGLPASLLH